MDFGAEFQKQVGRIDGLVRQLESASDPALKDAAKELMAALMQLHGAGLERILQMVEAANGDALAGQLASDPLVGSLLVLYGLHPDDLETRVQRGLDQVRLLCRRDGARLEEIVVNGGLVRLRVSGGGSPNLEGHIRDAILEHAPDAAEIVILGLELAGAAGFVPLASIVPAVQS